MVSCTDSLQSKRKSNNTYCKKFILQIRRLKVPTRKVLTYWIVHIDWANKCQRLSYQHSLIVNKLKKETQQIKSIFLT